IMEGAGLRAGAVGALRDHQDAIELARRVMTRLPHVLVVGEGASKVADEMALTAKQLLTPEAEAIWREPLSEMAESDDLADRVTKMVRQFVHDQVEARPSPGTVNFIARDANGLIASGVSTSGWPWKYPGRIGDSPIIGAGNYADNRWGAAACTGRGEMAQRACTAHSVVTFLRFGQSLDEAVTTAMTDLRALDDPYASEMSAIALDARGRHAAASTSAGRTYIHMAVDMSDLVEAPRLYVPLHG